MIKYILTDLDGVIRKWDNSKLKKIEEKMNITEDNLLSICFESKLLNQVITGEISDNKWRELVEEKYSSIHRDLDVKKIIDLWTNSDYKIDEKVIFLYKKYFPEAKIILVTNATSKLNRDLLNDNIYNCFDVIFNSSELGFCKPNKKYYESIKSKLNLSYDEVIYIDDSKENISTAKEFGIRSLLYEDKFGLEQFLINSKL